MSCTDTSGCLKQAIELKKRKAQLAPEDDKPACARLEEKLDDILHHYALIEDQDAARFVAWLKETAVFRLILHAWRDRLAGYHGSAGPGFSGR
ncbi:MAG: hypothetical protein JXR77_02640 [Lentisphaeria bacterium]|nr:hypothetical protein [Lentisphaeria bacterium]